MLFPLARLVVVIPVLFFPLFFEVPAIVFAAFWFFTQVLQGIGGLFMPAPGGGIAWWAHAGGFVAASRSRPCCVDRAALPDHQADEGILGFDPRASMKGELERRRHVDDRHLLMFFIFSALQPVLRQRLLDAMRIRKIAQLERKRKSRVILLVHRQETMRLLGFPSARYIDINDSEQVCARSR